MASHDLHFSVSQNGVEDPSALHDSPAMPPSPQQGDPNWGRLSQSSHPVACIFHVIFKALAIFLYMFGGWFVSCGKGCTSGANFITVTVCCMLLLAADFWVVKNITGRLMVGLRWWNHVEGDTTKWIFESAENRAVNQFDKTIFWTVLYAAPAVWSFFLFFGIIKLELGWLIIVLMALGLSGANVYGYYKCSSDQKARWQQMMQQGQNQAASTAFSALKSGVMSSGVMSFLAGTSTQQPQGQPQQQTFV